MKMAANASDTDSDDILAFYPRGGREGRGDTGVYLYTRLNRSVIFMSNTTTSVKALYFHPMPCAISFHTFFFFSTSLKSRRPFKLERRRNKKLYSLSTSTISISVSSDMLKTGAQQSQIIYAYRVSPGPSYAKKKELIG